MSATVASVEIDRSPEQVFAYAIDPAHLADWQENVVSASAVEPLQVGSRVVTTRRLRRREHRMTMELTSYDAPRGWSMKGVDGPIRPLVDTRINPLGDGSRSRVTIRLDFRGEGIGKVLVPLLVQPEARRGLPRNLRLLGSVTSQR